MVRGPEMHFENDALVVQFLLNLVLEAQQATRLIANRATGQPCKPLLIGAEAHKLDVSIALPLYRGRDFVQTKATLRLLLLKQ